jgi:hypothetical protein
MIISCENFPGKIIHEVNFVHYEAFVADKKFVWVLQTATQQENNMHVAASLQDLSVNLRPDF